MLKKVSSFTLFLGILSSITCQGVSGAETTFKDKNNQVVERKIQTGKENLKAVDSAKSKDEDDLKRINFLEQDVKTENAKKASAENKIAEDLEIAHDRGKKQGADLSTNANKEAISSGVAMQNLPCEENFDALIGWLTKKVGCNGLWRTLFHIDENCDVFINWLSKKCGFQENWYNLFHTYEGDEIALAKKVICIPLILHKCSVCLGFIAAPFVIVGLLLAFPDFFILTLLLGALGGGCLFLDFRFFLVIGAVLEYWGILKGIFLKRGEAGQSNGTAHQLNFLARCYNN